ncbi:MAG: hypothetical protein KF770_31560 [Anaerolineae bacterium]|nr:hypothetical protein [Anaerolineae bacterium]
MLRKLFAGDRKARADWDNQAVWYRVRYTDPTAVHKCLLWLSTAHKVGRVALWQQVYTELTMLHVGIPAHSEPILARMAADYGFSIHPKGAEATLPPATRLAPLDGRELPWQHSFMAHVVAGRPFVTLLEDEEKKGNYWPVLSKKHYRQPMPDWTLPLPRRGTSQQPIWPAVNGAHADLTPPEPDTQQWLLGWGRDGRNGRDGRLLQAGGQLNLYGEDQEAANWLAQMVVPLIQLNPAHLIIIDGHGNLVPRLKRKPSILRLIGSQLHYSDMDNTLVATGFNPLAPVPGESEAQTIQRWQAWFSDMGVHRSNLPVLAEAFTQGTRQMGDLRRWLNEPGQQMRPEETASLVRCLESFLEQRFMQEWVEWPVNPFHCLPAGGLLFACQSHTWERLQLLNAILLGALHSPHARLILHGIPWQALPVYRLENGVERVLTSNGPLFPEGQVVLTRCAKPEAAAVLASRFFPDDAQMKENFHLLQPGESMVIHHGKPVFTTWNEPRCLPPDTIYSMA